MLRFELLLLQLRIQFWLLVSVVRVLRTVRRGARLLYSLVVPVPRKLPGTQLDNPWDEYARLEKYGDPKLVRRLQAYDTSLPDGGGHGMGGFDGGGH